ncbi:MAG: divalent-cation tolerance protein CutA [Acidobacteriota bacterium]
MANDTEAIVVFMTAPSREEAGRLAQMMVRERLAACVQILPEMESVYRWQDQIEQQREVLIIAKTTKSRFEELEVRVRASHSYETPEIVALHLIAGSPPYLEWLSSSVEPQVEVADS